MKKQLSTILLILAGAAACFGLDFSLSAGAGGILGGTFTQYTLAADGTVDGNRVKVDAGQEMDQFNYGFFAFIDATYAEFSITFQNGTNTFTETFSIPDIGGNSGSGEGWETMLGLSLLGKYPFNLNGRFTVFPLLGAEYQISLKQQRTQSDGWVYDRTDGLREKDKDGKPYRLEDWNSLYINIGGGLDMELSHNFFLRGTFLYGFRLMTPYEVKNLELTKSLAGDRNPTLAGLTSGPSLRISVGYRFSR